MGIGTTSQSSNLAQKDGGSILTACSLLKPTIQPTISQQTVTSGDCVSTMFRSSSTTSLRLVLHSCFQHRSLRSHLLDRQASRFLSQLRPLAGPPPTPSLWTFGHGQLAQPPLQLIGHLRRHGCSDRF